MECGGYQRAKELLHEQFGDAYAISTACLNKITGGPKVNNESLQEFADKLLRSRKTLNAIGCLSEVNQRVLVQLAERLPTYLQHRLRHQVSKLGETKGGQHVSFQDFVKFVQMAAREVNDPVFGSLGADPNKAKEMGQPPRGGQPAQKRGLHGATAVSQFQKVACHCDGRGSLFNCEEFKRMTPEKRYDLARTNKLCFICLRCGHSAGNCKLERFCSAKGCKIRHTKCLHTENTSDVPVPQRNALESQKTKAACSYTNDGVPRVILPVVAVHITSKCGRNICTHALLDTGSTPTFCAKSLLEELKSEGKRANMSLSTLSSHGEKLETTIHELEVTDIQGHHKVIIHRVYATDEIPTSSYYRMGKKT